MRRLALALLLFTLAGFLALGSGFAIYWRLAYIVLLAIVGGFLWSWLNLRGLELRLERRQFSSQVGIPLKGHIRLWNHSRWPKAWLEVEELTDLPEAGSGRVLGLGGQDAESWDHMVECRRRGVYSLGPIMVSTGDPFGLFKLSRRFLQKSQVVVYPRSDPLPNLKLPIANFPSDGRLSRRSLQVTSQAASLRRYAPGDSVKRIHWPYTARLSTLMVKEFDQGVSSDAWILLDLQSQVHFGDGLENTEELAITVAASVAARLLSLGIPVGLAGSGDQPYLLGPDRSPGHGERLLESLAVMKAQGEAPLERALDQVDLQVSRYTTLVIITPSMTTGWVSAVTVMRRHGVLAAAILIDASGFGAPGDTNAPIEQLYAHDIPTYVVKRGQPLDQALMAPLNQPGHRMPLRMERRAI